MKKVIKNAREMKTRNQASARTDRLSALCALLFNYRLSNKPFFTPASSYLIYL